MDERVIKNLGLQNGRVVIVSDAVVASLYGEALCMELQRVKPDTILLTIPPGESSKSRQVKEVLEDRLIGLGASRKDVLVALGGGVVTDVVGFVAATYLRGVNYIAIPTTLMGMVDAAIGGKNGINLPGGKNLIGSLHAPIDVFIDLKFLSTLPDQIFREGFIEVIKYGLIWDLELFSAIEKGDVEPRWYIERSIEIKREVVKRDPSDFGLRRVLNYGHLVAHAIEKCTHYTVSHGRAVWLGLLIESVISHMQGTLSEAELDRIKALLLREEIRFMPILGLSEGILYEAMRNDKKADRSTPRVVLLKRIGKVASFAGEYCTPLSYETFCKAFASVNNLIANPSAMRSFTV